MDNNADSILRSVARYCNIPDDYTRYDQQLIQHINGVLAIVLQLGVGETRFRITGESETWTDIGINDKNLEDVKDYVSIRVKLIFDPPTNSTVLTMLQEYAKELGERINYEADKGGDVT